MSTGPLPPLPPSPGVGARRKGPKSLPRLPLSAFSPPNSGTSERFPLAPSPSALHPSNVIDSHLILSDDDTNLTRYSNEIGKDLERRIGGVVVSLANITDVEKAKSQLTSRKNQPPIISILLPFHLDDSLESRTSTFPSQFLNSDIPVSSTTVYTNSTNQTVSGLRWALEFNRPVDIDIQVHMTDAGFEAFQEILSKATMDLEKVPPIVISNFLPPPHDTELPIVKLMNHPTYITYQSRIAALSLIPTVHIKYLPPSWGSPAADLTSPDSETQDQASKQKKESKRRIKMYLSPVIEAFGFERIIFGTSNSSGSMTAGDWYHLARESLAELGVEQDVVDAVFCGNAQRVYQL